MKLDCDFSVMPDPQDYDKIHIIVDVIIPRGIIYQILVGIGVITPTKLPSNEDTNAKSFTT